MRRTHFTDEMTMGEILTELRRRRIFGVQFVMGVIGYTVFFTVDGEERVGNGDTPAQALNRAMNPEEAK